jgi:hypothetical protein
MAVVMNDVVMAISVAGGRPRGIDAAQLPRGQPLGGQVRSARADARVSRRNAWTSAFEARRSRQHPSNACAIVDAARRRMPAVSVHRL